MGSNPLLYSIVFLIILVSGCSSEEKKTEQTSSTSSSSSDIHFWESTFQLYPVVKNMEIPWDMVYDSEGYIWFTEKKGNVYRLKDRTWELEHIHTIDEVFMSQEENSGLHSMMLHPQWPDSSYVYCHYTYTKFQSKLVRYHFDQASNKLIFDRNIFDPLHAERSHNGSRMTIDEQGCILFCIGEAYRFDPALDTNDYSGKVLRFNPDGSVPEDNPFGNHVWSIGHRNPQGLYYGSNGILYSAEHGPATDDEINIIEKGGNYGWPKVLGYCDTEEEKEYCATHKVNEPLWAWTPTEAPSSIAYYGSDYFPEWKNSLLQCFLKGGRMHWLPLTEDGRTALDEYRFFCADIIRIRDVLITPDGRVFLTSSNMEVHKPPSFPEDDKVFEVINLNKEGELKLQFTANDQEKSFEITSSSNLMEGEVSIVNYIGTPQVTERVDENSKSAKLNWWPEEAGYYFIKIKLIDGRNIQKRFTYEP